MGRGLCNLLKTIMEPPKGSVWEWGREKALAQSGEWCGREQIQGGR